MSETEPIAGNSDTIEDEMLDFVPYEEFSEGEGGAQDGRQSASHRLTNVLSLPWKDVSHVLIGPRGITLIPPSAKKKYPYPSRSNMESHPTPGADPDEIFSFSLDELAGAIERASYLEKELEKANSQMEQMKAELENFAKSKTDPKDDEENDKKKKDEECDDEEHSKSEKKSDGGGSEDDEDEEDKEKMKAEEKQEASMKDGSSDSDGDRKLAEHMADLSLDEKIEMLGMGLKAAKEKKLL